MFKFKRREIKIVLKITSIVLVGAFITGGIVSNSIYSLKKKHESEILYLEEKYTTNNIRKDAIIANLNETVNNLSKELDSVPDMMQTAIEEAIAAKTPEIIEEYKKQLEAEQQQQQQAIENERQRVKVNRGGYIGNASTISYRSYERVKIEYTYYYADSTLLQGGYDDKLGKRLKSHNYPIVALPEYVSYGSELVLDESVPYTLEKNYSSRFISVDTGGAIVDKGYDGNGIRVLRCDIFVPDAYNLSSITSTLSNGTVYGTLYYK